MNIDQLRQVFAPWIEDVVTEFSKSFLFDYGIETLAFLHEKIDEEIESVYSARLKNKNCIISKSEALFTALTYLYNHFCWKMSHQKESPNVKKSCVKLLSQLIKTGLILSKGTPISEWINRILTAIRLFTGEPELIYEAVLLVSCLKPKYHRAYIIILKHVLINEDQECITDPLIYMEVILLFRRLKGLLKKKYSRACVITLAARIKPPCNLISWLMSLDVEGVNGLKYKTLAKQLMRNKVPETLLKKVRDIALSCYVFKSDIKKEKFQEAPSEPSDLFFIDASSVNDSHSLYQKQKLPSNVCISSESNSKTVSLTSSKKKKKKKRQLIISQEQAEDECIKSETSGAHETVIPLSYINDYSNLIAERDRVQSTNESEDYYMASQSDSSVTALPLKDTSSKSNISAKSMKKKQKPKISYKNLSPNAETYNKEQKIEIIEILCSDDEPCVGATDANKIPKTKKRKPPADLQSTSIASDSKKKMIKVDENENLHSSSGNLSNLDNHMRLSEDVSFSEPPVQSNTNSQVQSLENSKTSRNLIYKMTSKQNANKTVRLTENTKELSTEILDLHMSSAESVADSCTSVNMTENAKQNTNIPSNLHVPKKGVSSAKKISEGITNKIISISDFSKKSSITANVSENKLLLESNLQSVSMEVDEEAAVKVASSENKITSLFSKESEVVSENVQNDDFLCKDSDNHLLFVKYPSKEINMLRASVENSNNSDKESANLEFEQSESSLNCICPNEITPENSIDNSLKLSVTISNSNSSEKASEDSYYSFVRRNVKGRLSDISVLGNASINTNLNCAQNEQTSEKLMYLGKESVAYIATSENPKLQSKFSQTSNVQLLKSASEDKFCEENFLSSDATPTCSEYSVLSVNEVPETSNYALSTEKQPQRKRKLSDNSKFDDASLPVNYDSVETELNKNSEKLIHFKKVCIQNVSSSENVQLQAKCVEVSDGQDTISLKDLASNKIAEVNSSPETSSKCSESQHLVANSSQEVSENVFSENHQHKKLFSISDAENISSQKPCESMEVDPLKVSQKPDQVKQNSVQIETSNNNVESESKGFLISDTHANTSPQNDHKHDVFQEINVSSENSSKCCSTVLSCNFSEENSENTFPKMFQDEHKISDDTNSDSVLPSQNSRDLIEANSRDFKCLSEESVKNISSCENSIFQLQSPVSDSQSKVSDPYRISEEKHAPSKISLKFSDTCNLNTASSQEILKNIPSEEHPKMHFPDISTNAFLQGSHDSIEIDSEKQVHLGEKSVEGKLSDENIELKSSQESSNLYCASSGNADQNKVSEEISLPNHKSSGTAQLNAATNEETSTNVSCSFEKKNMKRKLSDISGSNETPVLESCDHVENDSFKDSDKVMQADEVLVRNESVIEDVESKSTVPNICNSILKNSNEDTVPEKVSLSPECIVKHSSSSISANIALKPTENLPVIERYQDEKLDISNSNVKPIGENYNEDKSESSNINFTVSLAEGSSNLTQNNNQCEQYETEIKIKTSTLANSQNVAEEPIQNSSPVKRSDNLDNFKTADLESCSTPVQSVEEKNTDKPLLLGNTGPEHINAGLNKQINPGTELPSDKINNSTLVPDVKSEISVKNASPKRQSQLSKFILPSSGEAKSSTNNSDVVDSSSIVTDSESKFSSKYSSSESIDILHISDEGESYKKIDDAKDSNIQNVCKEVFQKTPESKAKTLKQVELTHDEECSKSLNENSVLNKISKNTMCENFPYTCKSENYLSFSDISLSNKRMSIIDSCSESSNKLKNFSFAASTEIFSSYRNDLLSEEDKTSVLSCGPELKDSGSCKSQELSDDEKSKISSDETDGECHSDHSNSEVETNQMIDKIAIAPVESSSAEVALKAIYDFKTEESSEKEISENVNESSCNEKNSAAIETDIQSKNKCIEDHTPSDASSQKIESTPRHSLRLRNKAKNENETQCDSSENASHKDMDFCNREIDGDSKKSTEKDNSVCDNEKDISSINKVPPSPESIISKTPAKLKSQSKSKSIDAKLSSTSSRRYPLRQKCKKRDDSSKLGIDLSQLHLGSPSRRKPTNDNSIIAKLLPLDSDSSEKVDEESDLTLSIKRETRSSTAKALKEDTVLNTPSYNLRTRKSIIAPGKLKI